MLKEYWLVGMASALLLLGCESEDCDEGGRSYPDGAEWTCADGCNSCECSEGSVRSTLRGCPSPPGPAAGKLKCKEGGTGHTHGDEWTTSEGCAATCDDGKVVSDCG